MAGGPYDQSGLSEGFATGYGLALQKAHADLEKKRVNDDLLTSEQNRQLRATQAGREDEQYQYGVSQRGAAEKAAAAGLASVEAGTENTRATTANTGANTRRTNVLADLDEKYGAKEKESALRYQNAQTGVAGANARYLGEETRTKKQANDAQQGLVEAFNNQAKSRIASFPDEFFSDPAVSQSVIAVDAFLNHGAINPNNPIKHDEITNSFNTLAARELSQWNGQKLTGNSAKTLGVPDGSEVLGTQVAEFHLSPDKSKVILDLTKIVKTPDGRIIPIQAPYALNEEKRAEGGLKPLEIPLSKLQQFSKGAANLAQGVEEARKAGYPLTREGVISMIDDNAKRSIYEATNPRSVVSTSGNSYSTARGEQIQSRNSPDREKELVTALNKIRVSKLHPEEKAAQIAATYRDFGFNPDTGSFDEAGGSGSGFSSSSTNPSQLGQPGSKPQSNPYEQFGFK